MVDSYTPTMGQALNLAFAECSEELGERTVNPWYTVDTVDLNRSFWLISMLYQHFYTTHTIKNCLNQDQAYLCFLRWQTPCYMQRLSTFNIQLAIVRRGNRTTLVVVDVDTRFRRSRDP
ncbi:uncharacterized protein BDCG_17247 [Blastomyces dermatitidis ER-3]|uniref:Uncharacterized protein n=1 Tax=Ajellomyces dermatitidis (strain ER-3 / ATCC MYA-2586) TaxID=559297 RepID=A0ABX2VXE2_AJEDR|nr:uncharacterized protein BDCG_17247 [Blastomyces dermatitidis ER-3]OAT01819.1 hypothetical protein BDCG_17247 [Blastomyces dermatitidis ER-3]